MTLLKLSIIIDSMTLVKRLVNLVNYFVGEKISFDFTWSSKEAAFKGMRYSNIHYNLGLHNLVNEVHLFKCQGIYPLLLLLETDTPICTIFNVFIMA